MSPKRLILVLVVSLTLAVMARGSTQPIVPGTPCPDPSQPCTATVVGAGSLDPEFTLPTDPGVVSLGIFVVPGDVVLFETPNGSLTDPSTWSDVVEFSDSATGRGSIATTFPDAEGFGVILPAGFSLSANAVGILETTTGSGSDATDSTDYTAGTALYHIHSDCASAACEAQEPPETPEPATLSLLGLGLAAAFGVGRNKARQR
jgi:hypothetical protein